MAATTTLTTTSTSSAPAPGRAQRARREAARHHAGRERPVGEAQHGPAAARLGARALGVDRDVDRAGGRAQDEQGGAQGRRGGGQPWKHRRPGERGQHRRQRRGAPPVDERPRPAHRGERAGADEQQGHAQLPVVHAGVRLDRGQRGAPGAPEGAEGGKAAQHAYPSGHAPPAYPGLRRPTPAATLTAVAASCRPRLTVMPSNYFLKIDGIPGESLDAKHKDEIEVLSWSWGETQPAPVSAGGGAGSGKVAMGDLQVNAQTSRASPQLLLACASGKHLKSAVLTGR